MPIHSPGFCDACRLNPDNAGTAPGAVASDERVVEQAGVDARAWRNPTGRGQSRAAREGYQRPSYYWEEFCLAEQQRDAERRERTIREYYLSQGDERDDPDDEVVRDFTEIQIDYERLKRRWGSYSWRKIRNNGVIRSCIQWVEGPETEGFRFLVGICRGGLTTEALVIQHSDRFRPKVVERAARRVLAHARGFPQELVDLARDLLAR